MAEKRLIDLYPYKLDGNRPAYLLLKRASGQVYHGQWRMIGGKVLRDEEYWQAALRELMEETALKPRRLWTVPSINSFYEYRTNSILHIPAFAAEVDGAHSIQLNREHSEYSWFEIDQALDKIFWPEQRRLLKLTDSLLTSNQILEDWLVPIS